MSGHLRYMSKSAAEYMNSFDGDIFLATWSREDCYANSPVIDIEDAKKHTRATAIEIVDSDSLLETMKAKNAYFEKYRTFDAECHKNRKGYDSFCMFHIMKRAWLLLKEHENKNGRYDTIIRFRPDYVFNNLPHFQLEPNTVYFPQNSVFLNITDNLFIADREAMERMMLLPDLIDTYLLKENAVWCHEHLISHHLAAAGLQDKKIEGWTYMTADGMPPGIDKRPMLTVSGQKIIATMIVRNEEDIIFECIEHTLKSVDHIILTDNGSMDATRKIASSFSQVTIIDEPSLTYRQDLWQTRMADIALDMGATWVVPIDADEFWEGIDNIRLIPTNFGVALADCLYNHKQTDLIEEPFSRSQMPCFYRLDRQFGIWQSGRFAFRPYRGVKIGMGQDNIVDYKGAIGVMKELWIHHYPIRSYDRYIKKITQGVEAIRNGNHHIFVGSHWKEAHRQLEQGTLHECYDKEKILLKKDDR